MNLHEDINIMFYCPHRGDISQVRAIFPFADLGALLADTPTTNHSIEWIVVGVSADDASK